MNQARYVRAELAGSGSYMIALGHSVGGRFDPVRFADAAEGLVKRHDALRTSFQISDGSVTAVVSQEPRFQLHSCELTDPGLAVFRTWALPLVFDDVDPLRQGSLVRFLVADMGESWRFTIAAHHAITDGFSRNVMCEELLHLYTGETLQAAQSYYDYSCVHTNSPDALREAEELVNELPKPVRLVGDGAFDLKDEQSGQFVERGFGDLQTRLRALGKSIGATQFGLLSAAYALGLHGYSGETAISSFFQAGGRRSLGAPTTVVGPFSNTLPFDLSVDLDQDFESFARGLSSRTRAAVALENEPILDFVLEGQKTPSVSINMFPSATPIQAGGLSISPREFLDRRTEYDLNLIWSADKGAFSARAFYDPAQLSATRAELFLEMQGRILTAAVQTPSLTCRELLKIVRSGHEAVIPPVGLEPEPESRLHQSFFDWAEREPDATAIITSKTRISYGELAEWAMRIAGGLREAGVEPGQRVAIFAQRDPSLIAAMLGISASGASFAPIDAAYPVSRINRILDQLETQYLVEAGANVPSGISEFLTCIRPMETVESTTDMSLGTPRDAAYHLFTSGTTGQPKLTTHPDKTLLRFVAWQSRTLGLPEPITTMMMAGLAHDPTLRDVFLPLTSGGTVAIPSPCEMMDPRRLRELFVQANCNVLRLSPTSARLLNMQLEPSAEFDQLKAIFWGGERLPHGVVEQWRILAPKARQFNVFGTTETPQAFLIHEIDGGAVPTREVAIGRALPWTGAQLVADDASPVSVGEVGEIVADLADPVDGVNQKTPPQNGAASRHFTGDIGYQMPGGLIYFAGRRDGQVKINGFRVELSEVEAAAEATVGVERACALVLDERLVLFVLTGDANVKESTVRATLSRTLPGYMLPARIAITGDFPYTANGKIDREALAATTTDPTATEPISRKPLSATEETIADIFARHTSHAIATRDQTLFDLGADSLSVIEVRLDLEAIGIKPPDDWLWMPVSELALLQQDHRKSKSNLPAFFEFGRIESFVLIRCLAILAVVAHHSGFEIEGGGASVVLFALAGFSFGRLQLPAVLKSNHAGRVWALLGRVLVPLLLLMVVYTGINAFRGVETHISALLPFRNLTDFVNVVVFQREESVAHLYWLWFLHVYIQVFLILGILLSFSGIRRQLAADAWRSIAVFFLVSEMIGVAAILILSPWSADLGASIHLLRTSPTTIMPFIAIGALAAVADTHRKQVLTFALALLHFAVCNVLYVMHAEYWWIVALVFCTVFPFVSLPRTASIIVVTVAAYSLMIYLTHIPTKHLFQLILGDTLIAQLANMGFQVTCGVALGMMMRPILEWLGVNRIANRRVVEQ